MSKNRFNAILKYLFSDNKEKNDSMILAIIDATNSAAKEALSPGLILVIDESMVKSYHRNLQGKIKIFRKPRPISNEFKNLCCGITGIVLHLELYERKDLMKDKATTLRITESWKGSG